MIQIINADVRNMPLADASVDCVITSPPYWGLRDYGTARWEGGDPACDHKVTLGGHGAASGKQVSNGGTQQYQARATCPTCGATRVDRQLGLEKLHDCQGWARGTECQDCYICALRRVFREVWRVLKPEGTCWVNMGDCYAGGGRGGNPTADSSTLESQEASMVKRSQKVPPGLKPKDLVGQPWRLALALQADGWYLRQDIIWAKPNPMPESCRDRATKAHEYLFFLTKRQRYYFNQDAWLEQASPNTHARLAQNIAAQAGSDRAHDETRADRPMKAVQRKMPDGWKTGPGSHGTAVTFSAERAAVMYATGENSGINVDKVPRKRKGKGSGREDAPRAEGELPPVGGEGFAPRKLAEDGSGIKNNGSMDAALAVMPLLRNRRSVWDPPGSDLLLWLHENHPKLVREYANQIGAADVWWISPQGFKDAHFATFPEALVAPCIIAGCPPGGVVLDPFAGSGTTLKVANILGRRAIGLELNPQYIEIARRRVFPDMADRKVRVTTAAGEVADSTQRSLFAG